MLKRTMVVQVLLLIMIVLVVTSCGILEIEFSPKPTEDDSSEILADCFNDFYLSAWIDDNCDGIWNSSERPLADVEFYIEGKFANMLTKYPCISNEEGQCTMMIWSPGMCSASDYTITMIPPETYKPTTPDSVTIHLTSQDFSAEAQFGFCTIQND